MAMTGMARCWRPVVVPGPTWIVAPSLKTLATYLLKVIFFFTTFAGDAATRLPKV